LHEALHQKLYDIRHTHSGLRGDFPGGRRESEVEVVSLWNTEDAPGSNRWAPSRCLAAFHVYVHLAVYAKLADAAKDDGFECGFGDARLVSAESAFRRALYLGAQLRDQCAAELGVAGQSLVEWLSQCLESTSEVPSDSELRAALFLERYDQEARSIGPLIARTDVEDLLASPIEGLSQLVEREISSTRQVLSMCQTDQPLAQFDQVLTTCLPPDHSTLYLADVQRVREAVRRALTLAAVGDGRVEAAPLAHRVVESMVDASSTQLQRMLSGLAAVGTVDDVRGASRDRRAELLQLTDIIGEVFGTEDFCLFLFSLVRMHVPKVIVELRTGLGTSAFWMALAAEMNGVGHVWTVDDLSQVDRYSRLLSKNQPRLAGTVWQDVCGSTGLECMVAIREILRLEEQLTFVQRKMELGDPGHFDGYDFQEPVDMLFSDFNHGPSAILELLGHFLPRMARASSVFIDGASTSWPSYLLLEQLVEQLNQARVPALLQDRCSVDLASIMRNRRIVLVHLTKAKRRVQNSTAWLKLEPVDLQPHPATSVRGLAERGLG
jgi:hypothetical protein